jgi:NAD(P)-dependent dehydrogenase (short-subunit alcohol dehydrogenase family)
VAVVTGASSGLGARFARVLNDAGARVVLAARRTERIEALAKALPGAVAVTADLASAEDRERLIATALESCGTIDVLINNAGIGFNTSIEDEQLDQFRQVLELNVTAVWHLCKLAGEVMVANGRGSIVNVASMLGLVGATPIKQANYTASKGAVINMSRELALQWARKGVRVNALCPGWFATEMTAPMQGDAGSQAFVARNSPMPRMGAEDELDGPMLLLASRAGAFMTGHALVVDGGWTAR